MTVIGAFSRLEALCVYDAYVKQDGSADTISLSSAVLNLPSSLSGDACVIIKDTETYSEQITLRGITTNGYRIKIMADPSFVSSAPVVSPPTGSTAAFHIMNDSVTIQGITVITTNTVAYGVWASSAYVTLSSVNVDSGGNIWSAGIAVSSDSSIADSSVTVQNAEALYINGSRNNVSYSTMSSGASGRLALLIDRASSNTITQSMLLSRGGGALFKEGASYNTISYSTITNIGSPVLINRPVYFHEAGFNTIDHSYMASTTTLGVFIDSGSVSNTVSWSTVSVTAWNSYAFHINGGSSNTVTQSFIHSASGGGLIIDNQAAYNTVSYSTVTTITAITGKYGLGISVSSFNLITQSYIRSAVGTALLLSDSPRNTVSWSAIHTNASSANKLALYITGSSNTITDSFVQSASRMGGLIQSGYNHIGRSTFTSKAPGEEALYIQQDYNTVEETYIQNIGTALTIDNGDHNLITRSSMVSTGASPALDLVDSSSNTIILSLARSASAAGAWIRATANNWTLNNAVRQSVVEGGSGGLLIMGSNFNTTTSSNTIEDSMISSLSGHAVSINTKGAEFNTIRRSTLTAAAEGAVGLSAGTSSSSNTVSDCYIQGSTAAWLSDGKGNVLRDSVLIATAPAGNGAAISGTNPGAPAGNSTIEGNIIRAGPLGAGVYVGLNNRGLISVSTNIISGAVYGIYAAAQLPNNAIIISSNTLRPVLSEAQDTYGLYFNGLGSGATVQHNSVYYSAAGSMGSFASYGLYAQNSQGLTIHHNRFSQPGNINAGSYEAVSLMATPHSALSFNDFYSTGTALSAAYLLRLNSSSATSVKNNIFSLSAGTSLSSAVINVSADSQEGFVSDYNTFHSASGPVSLVWGAAAYDLIAPWRDATGNDIHSRAADPLFNDPSAEDFHPKSQEGRFDPLAAAFVNDAETSPTINSGDPAEDYSLETAPNGGAVNQGAYGNTSEASRASLAPANAPAATVVLSVSSSTVSLDWQPNANADPGTDYQVWQDTIASFAGAVAAVVSTSAHTASLLAADTVYYFKVRAKNAAGVFTAFDGVVSTRTSYVPVLPAAPTGAALGPTSIAWTWPAAPTAASYDVRQQPGGEEPLSQWASGILDFSSQYDSPNWGAAKALNAPDVGGCGDNPDAWAPSPSDAAPQYLELSFSTPVHATALRVRETYIFGSIVHISFKDTDDVYHTVWSSATATDGANDTSCPDNAFFSFGLSRTSYLVKAVRIDTAIDDWEEIDAVELTGLWTPPMTPVPLGTTGSASFDNIDLSTDTAYAVTVAGINGAGQGPFKDSPLVYTLAMPPDGSAAVAVEASSATLSWSLNTNPATTRAVIERSTDNAVFVERSSGAVVAYTDPGLLGCTTYFFRVRNQNGDGFATAYDDVVSFETKGSTPLPAVGLSAASLAGSRVALSWEPSPSEVITGYRLFYDSGTGLGSIDYNTPLAVFTSTETSYTSEVLASSAAYNFVLRAANHCGVEEQNTAPAAAASTAAVSGLRAVIKTPSSGLRVKGGRVTVAAELVSGLAGDVRQLFFEYKSTADASWSDIPYAGMQKNPDTSPPYYIHWDVDAETPGLYQLRAVARDAAGADDPAPAAVTIEVVASAAVEYDISENYSGGDQTKEQAVYSGVENTIRLADPVEARVGAIILPAGALATSTAVLRVTITPVLPALPSAGLQAIGSAMDISLSNAQSALSGGNSAALTFNFTDADGDGIVDDTQSRVDRLSVYGYAAAAGWSKIPSTVDASCRTVTGLTGHFSFFAVFGAGAAANLSTVRVYPVPFKPNSGSADDGVPFSAVDANSGIIFDNLPATVTIKIFTVTGALVDEVHSNDSRGKLQWDAKNSSGGDAASGVYFALITSPGSDPVAEKLMIIR